LHTAVRKLAGPCAQIQRCQIHKIRNVVEHLSEEHQMATRCKLRNAYASATTPTPNARWARSCISSCI
jgi:putative transposase